MLTSIKNLVFEFLCRLFMLVLLEAVSSKRVQEIVRIAMEGSNNQLVQKKSIVDGIVAASGGNTQSAEASLVADILLYVERKRRS